MGVVALLAGEAMLASRVERLQPFARNELDGTFGPATTRGSTLGDAGTAPLRIVWLGDSTGDGVGASSPANALPRQVVAKLGVPVELSVLAHSGARVKDVLNDQVDKVRTLRPDWVIVGIGGNDVTHLTSRRRFRQQMAELLDRVRKASPTRIIVVGIGEFAATPLLAEPLRWIAGLRADVLAADQRRIATEHHAEFVDIIGATGPRFVGDPKRYHARDGFHPSDEGYGLWADAIVSAIAKPHR